MIHFRCLILAVAMLIAAPGWAAGFVTQAPGSIGTPFVTRVQNADIPDVVRLLARRAARAERRGDMATANELYDAIRDLGYVVRRRDTSSAGDERGDGDRAQERSEGFGRDSDDDNDDDDNDDDSDDDDSDGDGGGGDEGDGDDD